MTFTICKASALIGRKIGLVPKYGGIEFKMCECSTTLNKADLNFDSSG